MRLSADAAQGAVATWLLRYGTGSGSDLFYVERF
jgi:hypothetical protein